MELIEGDYQASLGTYLEYARCTRIEAIAELRKLGWTVFCDEEEDHGHVR